MAKSDDVTNLSDEQLVQAFVDIARLFENTEHVGAANRLMGRFMPIIEELTARSGGTFQQLRPLLEHAEPSVRYSAAQHFSRSDHETFEKAMQALAVRPDEIGRKAQSSLDWDAYFQKRRYPELQQQSSPPSHGLPEKLLWQCDNPPPAAMSFTEIEQRLASALPAAKARRLVSLARPAIGLWPQRQRGDLPLDASRLGGLPYAPAGWSWPVVDTEAGAEPMLFIGHVNCAALKGLAGSDRLPSSGLLLFFGDHDTVMGCWPNGGAVFHFPATDRLKPAAPPIELTQVFPQCPLLFRQTIDLPDPYCNLAQSILEVQDQVSKYTEVRDAVRYHGVPDDFRYYYCGLSKLFGWPSLVQRHDLDVPDMNEPDGHRLLLQVDGYSNGNEHEGWGPGGSLYFMVPESDLLKRRFDRCELEMQCT